MSKKWICRFVGHEYRVWMLFAEPNKDGIVFVCSRCDKVSGNMTFPCDVDFDKKEPINEDLK